MNIQDMPFIDFQHQSIPAPVSVVPAANRHGCACLNEQIYENAYQNWSQWVDRPAFAKWHAKNMQAWVLRQEVVRKPQLGSYLLACWISYEVAMEICQRKHDCKSNHARASTAAGHFNMICDKRQNLPDR